MLAKNNSFDIVVGNKGRQAIQLTALSAVAGRRNKSVLTYVNRH